MPEITRFYGIVIRMYHRDHNPPHFHAQYGSSRAAIAIRDLGVIEGKLPARALGLAMEWASSHQAELLEDWDLAHSRLPLNKIEPLG